MRTSVKRRDRMRHRASVEHAAGLRAGFREFHERHADVSYSRDATAGFGSGSCRTKRTTIAIFQRTGIRQHCDAAIVRHADPR